MKQHEIISTVQDTGRLPTPQDAERAVHATLRALGERLAGGETSDLAAQLPPEFAADLPRSGPGNRFGVEEFYAKVAEYEGENCDPRDARRHARAVMAALKASLTGGEFDEVAAQLPRDYDDLLSTGPAQHH